MKLINKLDFFLSYQWSCIYVCREKSLEPTSVLAILNCVTLFKWNGNGVSCSGTYSITNSARPQTTWPGVLRDLALKVLQASPKTLSTNMLHHCSPDPVPGPSLPSLKHKWPVLDAVLPLLLFSSLCYKNLTTPPTHGPSLEL